MKFLNSFLGLVLLAFMQILQAQQSVKSILPLFSQKKQVEWAVQTDRNESVPVKWYERESSFAVEGIRTFVGYYNEQLVGALSVQRNDISGSIQWVGKAYHIDTRQGKVVISTSGADMNCGTCSGNFCASDSAEEKSFSRVDYKKQKFVYTDPVLRVYRLAITIDYSYFSRTFGFNKARVRGY